MQIPEAIRCYEEEEGSNSQGSDGGFSLLFAEKQNGIPRKVQFSNTLRIQLGPVAQWRILRNEISLQRRKVAHGIYQNSA